MHHLNTFTLSLLTAMMLLAACGDLKKTNEPADDESQAISTFKAVEGDSTLYGLACDGCTDSVIVFLPFSGGNPDTFNIIDARRNHRLFGRPNIGDELAILLNPDDSTKALSVFVLDELRQAWCYEAKPTLRPHAGGGQQAPTLPDSMLAQLLKPREYGFKLRRDYTASPIGFVPQQTSDEQRPVEYPPLKWYNEWRLFNGRLILTVNTTKMMVSEDEKRIEHDTADVVMLRSDTLVLRFADHEQGYYRMREDSLQKGKE